MKRTKLRDRALPNYTHGEELFNMITHIVGGGKRSRPVPYMHGVFHIFVLIGSVLHFIGVFLYML